MSSLAIIWRNPKHVRNRLRWSQQKLEGGRSLYIVQRSLSADQDVWVNSSVFEVISGDPTRAANNASGRPWRFGFGW